MILARMLGWLWSFAMLASLVALVVGSFFGVKWLAERDNRRLRKENARLRGELLHPLHDPIGNYDSIDGFLRATIGTKVG